MSLTLDLRSLPPAYRGCTCSCHRVAGIMHVTACCRPDKEDTAARVKAATGPDRELDCAIEAWLYRNGKPHYGHMDIVPEFTASVDAALALVERVLPGWMWSFGNVDPDGICWACLTEPEGPCRDFDAGALTLPLAIIAALLTALSLQGEK